MTQSPTRAPFNRVEKNQTLVFYRIPFSALNYVLEERSNLSEFCQITIDFYRDIQ